MKQAKVIIVSKPLTLAGDDMEEFVLQIYG